VHSRCGRSKTGERKSYGIGLHVIAAPLPWIFELHGDEIGRALKSGLTMGRRFSISIPLCTRIKDAAISEQRCSHDHEIVE
jgi:hypothetical protein